MNIVKRLFAETPKFWIRVQIICLVCSGLIAHLMRFMPEPVAWALVGIFGAGAVFAQLAVKDQAVIKEAIADPLSIIDNLSSFQEIVTKLLEAYNSHTPATLDEIKAILIPPIPIQTPNNQAPEKAPQNQGGIGAQAITVPAVDIAIPPLNKV